MSFTSMHNDYLDPDRYLEGDGVVDLAPAIAAAGLPSIVGYWDEDGNLFAGHQYDEDGRLPKVGELTWDDDKSEDENAAAAASLIVGIFTVDVERRRTLEKQLSDYIAHKRKHPAKVPSFSAWCREMSFPKGDFKWEDSEGSDWHIYNCGERDCEQQWHKVCYLQTIGRKAGKVTIEIRSCDEDGNKDFDNGYEQGEPAAAWRDFYREWLADTDSFFIGWAEYHLDCSATNTDPASEFMDANKACSSAAHLDAAADQMKYLKMGKA